MKQLDKLQSGFAKTQKAADGFAEATQEIGNSATAAGKAAERSSSGFGKFAQSIARIAKYRILRTILKEVTAAFKVGLQNAYQFSKGIGGDLAKAMDALSSSSLVMKNQLGAAFGQLVTMIQPIVSQIIAWLTRLAEMITQVFGLLRGASGYKKAVQATQDMAKASAGGAKSAKEWRNQLMGFDEINRLDAPTEPSGGGGGGVSTDANNMFEWVDGFSEKAKKVADIVEKIWPYVRDIGIALLGWKIAESVFKFFGIADKIPGFNGNLEQTLGLIGGIAGAIILIDGFIDAWKDGLDFENLIQILVGVTIAATGLGIAFGSVAAAIALLVGGIALVVIGLKDMITTGEVTNEGLLAISLGLLAIGAAIALLTGSWIPAVIAAAVAGIVAIVGKIIQNWDKIKAWASGVWTSVSNFFTRIWDGIKSGFSSLWGSVLSGISAFINGAIDWFRPLLSAIDRVVGFFGGSTNLAGAHVSFPSAPAYASGGMPEDGLFFANHSELVGQFANGQTAVANNEQIIAGIREGVYEAMMSANSGRSNDVRVYLDGKQITNVVTKNQMNMSRATGVAY